MKQIFFSFLFILFVCVGLLSSSVFVMATSTCYVDKEAKKEGNGSKDKPYQELQKTLDQNCTKIIIDKGIYEGDIVIDENVVLQGKNKKDVVIVGKVEMNNNSEISNITVDTSGIDVEKDAHVRIKNLDIKKADIGINVKGDGKFIAKNISLYNNRKGIYLQRGVDVDITNCDIYGNSENGIDIRDNVNGVINDNSIYDNGESGIEIILGESKLRITNNTIKKNKANGITVQYYKIADELSNIKIKDNKITHNKNFGIDCKVLGVDNPGEKYWSKSVEIFTNNVFENSERDFSDICRFKSPKIIDTTKIEQQKLEKIKKEQKKYTQMEQKRIIKNVQLKENEKRKNEQHKLEQQDLLRKKLQQKKELQNSMDKLLQESNNFYNIDITSVKKIQSRPSIFMFFIGPDYRELRIMAERIKKYDTQIKEIRKLQNIIADNAMQEIAKKDIVMIKQQKSEIYNFIKQYNDEFSIFGWIFRKKL